MKRLLCFATIIFTCIQVEGQRVSPFAKDAAQTIRELRAIGLPDFDNGEPECRSLDIRFREIVSIAFNP
jgi:hypothetical protein